MKQVTSEPPRRRFQLMQHRRIGLFSLCCLILGAGWLASAVMPGLNKAKDTSGKVIEGSSSSWLPFGALFGKAAPIKAAGTTATTPSTDTTPSVGTIEASFIHAPVGTALQMMLTSGRYSCSTDPMVTGVVTYTSAKGPKPFWEVIGRVIGAAPDPGVHVAQVWDSYRIFPRNVNPMQANLRSISVVPPKPVPIGEGHVTHRVAGYVSLTSNDGQPPVVSALLETRIPGVPPQWRTVRVGDSLQRKSAEATARETNAAANIDIALMVAEVTPHHITLRGGGNKTLQIPLSDTGVADTFGFSPDISNIDDANSLSQDNMPREYHGSMARGIDSDN